MRRLVLVLVCACGARSASTPVSTAPVGNHDGAATAPAACVPPTTRTLNARRRKNLDATDPDFGKTTPWHVILVRDANGAVTVVMDGDQMHWTFAARGVYDCAHAELSLDTHEPFQLELDVPARRGTITSIDDTWELY